MLEIIYPSLLFPKKNIINNDYKSIIIPIPNLYTYTTINSNIILNINFRKIKELIKQKKTIPYRNKFFTILNKIKDDKTINYIFPEKISNKISYIQKYNSKEILKIEDIYFNLEKKTIQLKSQSNTFNGGIYLVKYFYGRYKRDTEFENIILNNKPKNFIYKNNSPNLICVSTSRCHIWKEILKYKNFLFINNLTNYKKLQFKNILEYDYILITVNFINNSYYKKKMEEYKIDKIKQKSFINIKNGFYNNILWENEPVFHLYKWNNYIIDFSYNDLKKNMIENILHFECYTKWVIFNEYKKNNNHNQIFNLFNPDISINDISKFIIKKDNFEIKISLNIKKEFLFFNNKERAVYNTYIDDLKEIYNNENIKFEDDEYLRKYCSYPQKKIKINKILKNINDIDKFNKINKKYKTFIQNQLTNNNLDCKICLEKISSNNIGLTHCCHFFCFSCIYKNIKYSKTCPNCRENISIDKIYFVTDNTKKMVIDLDILDELGTKISTLLNNIKNYNKVLIISNFDNCLIKIEKILLELNINSLITKNIKNDKLEKSNIFLSNYDEDFLQKKYKINPEIIICIEPYYSNDLLIKMYDIYKFTNQTHIKFLIFKDTIEETYLNTCNIRIS